MLYYVLLRATAAVDGTVTRDVDETASIDNQPRKFTCLPGCLFLIALIIPYAKGIVQPFYSVWNMNLAQMDLFLNDVGRTMTIDCRIVSFFTIHILFLPLHIVCISGILQMCF